MTREEAIKIMSESGGSLSAEAWIRRFEALGLIKFDAPVKDNGAANCIGFSYQQLKSYVGSDLTQVGHAIIQDLEKSGYRIVKERDYQHLLDVNRELDRRLRNKS